MQNTHRWFRVTLPIEGTHANPGDLVMLDTSRGDAWLCQRQAPAATARILSQPSALVAYDPLGRSRSQPLHLRLLSS